MMQNIFGVGLNRGRRGLLARLALSGFVAASTVAAGVAAHSSRAAAAKALRIAFIRTGPDPYYQYGQQAAVKAMQQMGGTMPTYYSNNEQAQELANVEDAIAAHADGILMYTVSLSAGSADAAKAKAAHVPIFFIYGYNKKIMPQMAGDIQANPVLLTKPSGQWVARHVPSGEVAIITGLLGRGDAELYAQGFKDGMAQNPKLTIVAQLPGDWSRQKAYNAAQSVITQHPNLKALCVSNDDMAVGAILALKRAGKLAQVKVVSQNGAPYGLDAIRKGELQATDNLSPSQEAIAGLRLLVGVIQGKVQPGHLYYTPLTFITRDNITAAVPWDPTPAVVRRFMSAPLPKPVMPLP